MKATINNIHHNKIQQVLDYMGYKLIKNGTITESITENKTCATNTEYWCNIIGEDFICMKFIYELEITTCEEKVKNVNITTDRIKISDLSTNEFIQMLVLINDSEYYKNRESLFAILTRMIEHKVLKNWEWETLKCWIESQNKNLIFIIFYLYLGAIKNEDNMIDITNDWLSDKNIVTFEKVMDYTQRHDENFVEKINEIWNSNKQENLIKIINMFIERDIDSVMVNFNFYGKTDYEVCNYYLMEVADNLDLETIIKFMRI